MPPGLNAEHCVPVCSGEVFALDIAFYRTRPPTTQPNVNPSGNPALSGETLGVPNSIHIHVPSILQTLGLAPNDPACDFIACGPTIDSGLASAGTLPFPQVIDWAGEFLGVLGRFAGVAGVVGSVLMEQGDFDVRLARCNARYDAEKDACRAKYGQGGRFGKNRAVGACLDRAFYRYQACVRGQSDPAGPMASLESDSDDNASTCDSVTDSLALPASIWGESN